MLILSNPAIPLWIEKKFRDGKLQRYAATEEALINRYMSGEISLIPGKDFSQSNLDLMVKLIKNQKE